MSQEEIRENNLYYTIIAGSFRVQVDKDAPDAVRRDWTSADGKSSGTKYERIVNALVGYIEDVQFRDGTFGMQMYVMLDENSKGEKPVIALSTASREGEDLMKKLPNINFMKEVRLRPFNFEGSEGDEVRGIEVLQQDESGEFKVKITNYFSSAEKQPDGSVKRQYTNGFPSPEGDTADYSKDDWKLYFLQARKFLVAYTRNTIQATVAQAVVDRGTTTPRTAEQEERIKSNAPVSDPQYPTEDINPDDIPF